MTGPSRRPRRRRPGSGESRRTAGGARSGSPEGTRRRSAGRPAALQIDLVTSGAIRAPGLVRWLASVAPAAARGTMTIALVPDARVRALNRQYRGKNTPTDVLSFPTDEPGELGDVVIAAGVARRQA